MTLESNTLGELLRQERERRNITLEQVASATKIGVKTLECLEANQYAELPATPFVRGFVISYCRFVGLDAQEVLSTHSEFMSEQATARPKRDGGHSGYAFERKDGEQHSRTLLLIAISGFVVIGTVAIILLKPSFNHRRKSHVEKLRSIKNDAQSTTTSSTTPQGHVPDSDSKAQASVATEQSPQKKTQATQTQAPVQAPQKPSSQESLAKNSTNEPTESKDSSTPPSEDLAQQSDANSDDKPAQQAGADPNDPLDSGLTIPKSAIKYRTVFKVDEDIWVRYQSDNRPVRRFIIRKGGTLVLRATHQMRFQVSDPDAVRYSYNGTPYHLMNESKSAIEHNGTKTLVFPANAAQKIDEGFENSTLLPKIKRTAHTPDTAPTPDIE